MGGEFEQAVTSAQRPYEIASALIRALRRKPPTVLVLEDFQWADEATIDVLALLSARIETAPALVLITYRDDELDRTHQLRVVLGEIVRARGRIRIDPLSKQAVAELAAPHHVDADELYMRTGGNAFFVTEVLAAERGRSGCGGSTRSARTSTTVSRSASSADSTRGGCICSPRAPPAS